MSNLKNYFIATEIQEKSIPVLTDDTCDVIGQAQTGTGKTAAFGLPLIDKIDPSYKYIQALVLTPTRELAMQVCKELKSFNYHDTQIVPIYGGQSIDKQIDILRRNVSIVVGTPGRIIDHIERGTVDFSKVKTVIFDEADEMLDMGFLEEVEEILSETPDTKRTIMFSATMPQKILDITRKYMKNPKIIKTSAKSVARNEIEQVAYEVHGNDKIEVLRRLIDFEDEFYGIIFCQTKMESDTVAEKLKGYGYKVDVIHGDIAQSSRERVLSAFRNKATKFLIATDVAARGIDVPNLTHVVNFGLPQDPESYVHRIGRTGRAGKAGKAITIMGHSEKRSFAMIKKNCDIKMGIVPTPEQIVSQKRSLLFALCTKECQNEEMLDYAQKLLETAQSLHVIANLLEHAFDGAFDALRYKELKEVPRGRTQQYGSAGSSFAGGGFSRGFNNDRSEPMSRDGIARLFFARGKEHNMNQQSIADFIFDECQIRIQNPRDVHVLAAFSFINMPEEDAQVVLRHFKAKANGDKPICTRAKDKKPQ